MVKKRVFPEQNYRAFWFHGKTIRSAINPSKPITELKYPEFYDVKITGKCIGQCPWCYMDSTPKDQHYADCLQKIHDFFGEMTPNERPFQVAIGGGEPTLHPEFIQILRLFKDLDIEPNYTTNGMGITPKILSAAKKYCGGVAISCHPHLRHHWEKSAMKYFQYHIPLNFHLIISDKCSIDTFINIMNKWNRYVDYFVLLPYIAQGRAIPKQIEWEYLLEQLPSDTHKIAWGAGFYPYLQQSNRTIQASLYEPEIMSKFLDMKDMRLYSSSFATN